MTPPTNRPPDDRLEERLAASFERATTRAELDLADGRLAADAIDRGHRRVRSGAVWRVGLVLAAVAVLSAGMLWFVGGRPSPSPSQAPSVANVQETPRASVSLLPTDANGSQIPQPTSSDQGIPILDEGVTFPPTIDGGRVLPVGPVADAAIAAASDASTLLISGWWVPALRKGCNFDMGTPAPNGVYFSECAGLELAATPDGPVALHVYRSFDQPYDFPVDAGFTQVQRVLLRVHVHDAGCATSDCELKPVLDATLMLGTAHFGSPILAQTMPPTGVSLEEAIKVARPLAVDALHSDQVILLKVEAGPTLTFQIGATPNDYGPWVWAITYVNAQGTEYLTSYVDYLHGFSTSQTGGTVEGTTRP